ncbi:MAG: hypothetical protein ACI3XP_05305 [Eubacteriales bacterium]
MSMYYVSAVGDDAADGRTPESAWRTIPKVNASIRGGDVVRFRCGDTFYGHLSPPRGISMEQPTVYASYGEGAKPVISQYKTAKADAWEQAAPGIWKLDLSDSTRFTGNTFDIDANVGFLKVSDRIFPHKCFTMEELTQQWDFYNDDTCVFVCSEKHPAQLSDDIRFACRINCISFTDHLRVEGLVFRGTGAHGINGVVNGAYIGDCEFHEIGGSQLIGFRTPNTRYGNGVECWSNSSDVTVESCKFSGIYDVAITMQGTHVRKSWTNMIFRNNIMWNNQHCFEIWSSGQEPDTGFVNCRFENNLCIESGYGWSYAVRPDKTASTHLLMYGLQCPLCDITVSGNTFVNPRNMTVYKSGGVSQIPADYRIVDNTIICPAGQPLAWRDRCSEEEFLAYENMLRENNRVYTHTVYP